MTTFETLTEDQQNEVLEATNLVTIENLNALSYGEEIDLTNEVCLSHYCEEDIIVLKLTEECEEIFQILFNAKTKEIIFESL